VELSVRCVEGQYARGVQQLQRRAIAVLLGPGDTADLAADLFQPRTETTITTNKEEVGDLLAV
jgi:hypothetical protein